MKEKKSWGPVYQSAYVQRCSCLSLQGEFPFLITSPPTLRSPTIRQAVNNETELIFKWVFVPAKLSSFLMISSSLLWEKLPPGMASAPEWHFAFPQTENKTVLQNNYVFIGFLCLHLTVIYPWLMVNSICLSFSQRHIQEGNIIRSCFRWSHASRVDEKNIQFTVWICNIRHLLSDQIESSQVFTLGDSSLYLLINSPTLQYTHNSLPTSRRQKFFRAAF